MAKLPPGYPPRDVLLDAIGAVLLATKTEIWVTVLQAINDTRADAGMPLINRLPVPERPRVRKPAGTGRRW